MAWAEVSKTLLGGSTPPTPAMIPSPERLLELGPTEALWQELRRYIRHEAWQGLVDRREEDQTPLPEFSDEFVNKLAAMMGFYMKYVTPDFEPGIYIRVEYSSVMYSVTFFREYSDWGSRDNYGVVKDIRYLTREDGRKYGDDYVVMTWHHSGRDHQGAFWPVEAWLQALENQMANQGL